MRKLSYLRSTLVAVFLAAVFIASAAIPALAIDNPDSLTIGTVTLYNSILEPGDLGVFFDFTTNYSVLPTESATQAYIFAFCDTDGITELKTGIPYSLLYNGYGINLAWLYFSAAEVTADSITSTNIALYRVHVKGNPALTWNPGPAPSVYGTITTWNTTGTATILVSLDVIKYAKSLASTWSLDMVQSTPSGSKLTIYGAQYFQNVINNALQIAPNAFATNTTNPINITVNPVQSFGAILTNGTGSATGSPITLSTGSNMVNITVAGSFVLALNTGTVGTAVDGTAAVVGSPVSLVEGNNTITVVGIGNITITVRLYNTQVQLDDSVTGTGFDLTNVATAFRMSRGMFSGIVWFIVSIIICAAAYSRVGGKTTMLLFNLCIICGAILGLMPIIIAVIMFICFGALTGYVLFFRNAIA